ncbi:phosphotransferase enzyme family protein [Paenibacillus agri]|uniref:Phosphotransferase n=1 Tax=Paenibacillus agri TaxID=2744309 RepID=A0A850ETK0_9BACL|nr:phosphotransferase [Paenibacillus agri]NUU63019.1 phosphotransferase [Paenibacillus agri]
MINVQWSEQEPSFAEWLNQGMDITFREITTGFEADILLLQKKDEPKYVLKVWKQLFNSQAHQQYKFLFNAQIAGLPVPTPVGWGRTDTGTEVLATDFSGYPVDKPSKRQIEQFARVLYQIHHTPTHHLGLDSDTGGEIIDIIINQYFPDIEQHQDIMIILESLRGTYPDRERRLIHGDFNLGNILLKDHEITIIDWTNVQVGDIRYDVAWSAVLLLISLGENEYNWFKSAYLSQQPFEDIELNVFESIAALRWLLLNRIVSFPNGEEKSKELQCFLEKRLPINFKLR